MYAGPEEVQDSERDLLRQGEGGSAALPEGARVAQSQEGYAFQSVQQSNYPPQQQGHQQPAYAYEGLSSPKYGSASGSFGMQPSSPRFPTVAVPGGNGSFGSSQYAQGPFNPAMTGTKFENVDISTASTTPYERVHGFVSVSNKKFQTFLDSTTPHAGARWTVFAFLLLIFMVRVITLQGFYVVAYALGIYLLNIFLLFLSPKFDPAFSEDASGLDNDADLDESSPRIDEFRPFIRRLPEFKFWYNATKASVLSLVCTIFPFIDIPVFWPILLMYFVLLFALTMRRQIQHMVKYKYLPFDIGKKAYA